jgi:hypothetical protein
MSYPRICDNCGIKANVSSGFRECERCGRNLCSQCQKGKRQCDRCGGTLKIVGTYYDR